MVPLPIPESMVLEREKLIELLCSFESKHNSIVPDKQGVADHLIANGVTFGKDNDVPSKWIPVIERLPDTFGEYIVSVQAWEEEDGNLYTDYADYDPYFKKWKTGLFLGERDKITHWMPLPEPPKGE